jgi:hypothetical protein
MAKSITTILDAARRRLDRGYFPIPVPHGTKRCVLEGWPELRLTVPDIPHYAVAHVDRDFPYALHTWRELGVETGRHLGQQR